MLILIKIKNVAVIEEAEAEFTQGLNILTGETGAGKSIIIDSVNLILGERADRDLIRTGCDKAVVEAIFDIINVPLAKKMLFEMFEDGSDELLITREMSSQGKNICKVNGHIATLNQLKDLTKSILDLHGQHQHQSLLDAGNNIRILDSYCEDSITGLLKEYSKIRAEYVGLQKNISSLQMDETERIRRLDLLKYQSNEISNANLVNGEEEELIRERDMLNNYEKLRSAIDTAYEAMFGGDSENVGAKQQLDNSYTAMQSISAIDDKYNAISERINNLTVEIDDISSIIKSFRDEISYDIRDIDDIESRLESIARLKRKYGSSIEEILEYLAKITLEINLLENNTFEIETLIAKSNEVRKNLLNIGLQLSNLRRNAAGILEQNIVEQLSDLGMEKSRFKINITNDTNEDIKFYPDGIDQVEFLIATNVGEDLKPLSSVVSGGELSRIMLALKTISADIDNIPTLIFDEIDTGISGNVARAVSEKLADIATKRQVICVTHSAQIAAMADNHLYIEKNSDENSTKTQIINLKDDYRYKEISRLVGGSTVSSLSDDHAKQIIQWSINYKKNKNT